MLGPSHHYISFTNLDWLRYPSLLALTMFKRSATNVRVEDRNSKKLCHEASFVGTVLPGMQSQLSLMDLPPEIRNNIYRYIFTPGSSSDIHFSTHSTTLTLAWVEPKSTTQVKLCKPQGLHFSRPSNYHFLFASKQTYFEALPILAQNTSLRISGAQYWHLKRVVDQRKWRYLGELQNSVAYHTSHLILDQDALLPDHKLVEALVDGTLFPKLQKLTQYHCGPAQISNNWPSLNIYACHARKLAAEHKWPSELLRKYFSLTAESCSAPQAAKVVSAMFKNPSFPQILQHLRKRLDEKKQAQSLLQNTRVENLAIEVVSTLEMSGLFTTVAPCWHMILDKAVSNLFSPLLVSPTM